MDETEIPTGLASVEAIHGIERREEPAAPEPKVYEGHNAVEQAANDLTERRGRTSDAPIERVEYLDGERKSVSAEQAAHHLSQYHANQRAAAELDDLANLQQEVDLARLVYGPDGRQKIDPAIVQEALAAGQQSPQAEAPQPESPPVDEHPASGLSPKLQAFLSDPEIRNVVAAEYERIGAAEEAYRSAIAQNAAVATHYALSQIEELSGLSLKQASQALSIMDRKDPQRAFAIRQQLQGPAQMLAEAQRAQQAQQARAQHEHAVRLQAFRRRAGKTHRPDPARVERQSGCQEIHGRRAGVFPRKGIYSRRPASPDVRQSWCCSVRPPNTGSIWPTRLRQSWFAMCWRC
jgi:hypothetical protein